MTPNNISMGMGSPNVRSIAEFIDDEALAAGIRQSDYIRNETLRRLCAMPSYPIKTLRWKNIWYDYFRKQVEREIQAKH